MSHLTVVDHPIIARRLSQMHDTSAPTPQFRRLLYEPSHLLAHEAARDLPIVKRLTETPITTTEGTFLDEEAACPVSILRADNGLPEGLLDAMPWVRVGHVGLYRDHETPRPHQYYWKLPENLPSRRVFVLDPMLATGWSAAALAHVKAAGAVDIRFVYPVAAPEAMAQAQHPDVPILTAALDSHLDESAVHRAGLGRHWRSAVRDEIGASASGTVASRPRFRSTSFLGTRSAGSARHATPRIDSVLCLKEPKDV